MADKRIRIPLSRRLDGFRRRVLPAVIWGIGAVAVFHLLERRGEVVEIRGIAFGQEYLVTAPSDGRLQGLVAGLYGEVHAGQNVAWMDPEPLEAALATARAEALRLAAEVEAAVLEANAAAEVLGIDWGNDARRYEMDVVDLRSDILRRRIDVQADQVEAERLRVARDRAEALLGTGAESEAQAEDLRLAHAGIVERVAATQQMVDGLGVEQERAEARLAAFLLTRPEGVDRPPRQSALALAVSVQEALLQEIDVARRGQVLVAPVSGRVLRVSATPGRSLVLGEEILAILPDAEDAAYAYVPASRPEVIESGATVFVRRPGGEESAEATVVGFAPAVEELPQALWRDPAVPEFGRAAVLKVAHGLRLIPGEPLLIGIRR